MPARFTALLILGMLLAAPLSTRTSFADDSSGSPDTPTAANQSYQDLIFFGPLQPVILRLHLYVDGRPFRQAWRDHSRQRFESLDANHDGQIDVDEAKHARPPLALLASGTQALGGDAALMRFVTSRGRAVTLDECLDWQEGSDDGPFSVTESAAAALSDGALLELIDHDHDRRLARAEVESAIDVLRRRDFDNNEVLTRNELISGAALYQGVSASAASQEHREAGPSSDAALQEDRGRFVFVITPSTHSAQIAAALLARYDRDGDGQLATRLERREIALPERLFAELDTLHDGGLDLQDLAKFSGLATKVELAFQFGRISSDVPTIPPATGPADDEESTSAKSTMEAVRVRERSDGSYKVELPDALVELRRDNRHPTKNRSQEISFRGFDNDGNKYLDATEAARVIGKAPFSLLDADGDGMATEPEFEAFVTREGDSAGARLVLALTGEGQNLFDQIDANSDGGLTARELRTAGEQLAQLDQNGDGLLDGDELPQQVALVLARGRLRLPSAAEAAAMRRPRGAVRVEEEIGPTWFRKMDRNRDGDVSPREFLGPAEVFDKLDANQDGLIDAGEAEQQKMQPPRHDDTTKDE